MKIRISVYQLLAGIVMVPLGSALLFLITPEAKQDAWIAMLVYIIPGLIIEFVYVLLWQKYPNDTIVSYMPKIFGSLLGNIISILYILFFAYIAARIIRDITELVLISSMPNVPAVIITFIITLISCYYSYLGLECLSRSVNIFFYSWIVFFVLEWFFLFATEGAVKLYNLKPILSHGILPVIKTGWQLIAFPYGETVLLAMFFPFVKQTSKVKKYSLLSIIIMGVLLTLNTIMFISVLGIDFASANLFPLLRTIKIMRIGENFDRVDIFIILILMIGGVIKISFFMYGAMLGTANLIKIKDTKYLAIPFSIAIFFASIFIAKNYPEHIYIGLKITSNIINIPLEVGIPILALIVYYVKRLILCYTNNDEKN